MSSNAGGWGRREESGWPSRRPWWTLGAALVALLSVPGFLCARYAWGFSPLERYYFGQVVRGAIRERLPMRGGELSRYRLVELVSRKGSGLALPGAVSEGETRLADGGVLPFELADELRQQGYRMRVVSGIHESAPLRAWLSHEIYGSGSLRDQLKTAALFGLGVLVVGLLVALPKDKERARVRRYGRRLRGPELVTSEEFNRRNRSDGVGFTESRRTGLLRRRALVRVPRERETNHFLILGDTGMGKSVLIRQLLVQVEERGHMAIVYDPAREYVRDFYDESRGDVILNPLDERMPYWSPGAEVTQEGEALTLAKSLFPDRSRENPFFVEGPRKLFAHLLEARPTAEELTHWLCHPEEIERRVKGSELESMLDLRAPAQRAGVLSSLGLVVDALKLLPSREEARGEWSAAEWSRGRRGWLFLTSTGETREALRPLISLWLDMLVLRLMGVDASAGLVPVWFALDELASLQRLPQLHTAITENRKSGNPVVLGFQGRSQLEARYGQDAEAMLSQPGTKVFFRTSEARAAEWVSKTIGDVEIERMRESRTDGRFPQGRGSRSDMLERQVEPSLLPSQISGLPKLEGYLKSENLVVPLHVEVLSLPARAEGFVERKRKPRKRASAPPAPATAAPAVERAPELVPEVPASAWPAPPPSHDPEHFFE